MMKARFLVAATHKSSGKTMISTGLSKAISERGFVVQPFKKGPDYIDPMWLSAAAGRPCFNLDFHTMAEKEISSTFHQRSAEADVGIIESNKGLFDGLDVTGNDSNAALAKLLDLPVVLVVDTTGITRGIAPLLKGYEQFDPEIEIAGIILNKVGGPRHEEKLRAATAYYSDLPILGSIHRDRLLEINERHLGLTMPSECAASDERIARMRDVVNDGVDIDKLINLPATASEVIEFPLPQRRPPAGKTVRIGITMDSAFRFYYPDDLEAFADAGAELVPIDTLLTSQLPDIDGLFAGGGFPEIQMKALEGNVSLRRSIRTAVAAGLPVYAECGGLAYLARSITWGDQRCEMVGAIPGNAVMHERPQGRGYVRFRSVSNGGFKTFESGECGPVPAHEFHYISIEGLPADGRFARVMERGHGIDGLHDGFVIGNLMAGFCHLRNTVANPWVARFVKHVRDHKHRFIAPRQVPDTLSMI